MQRIVITGGLGYVGHELVRQVVEYDDAEVHVIDNLASGPQRLTRVPLDRFQLHVADITDGRAMRGLLEKVRPDLIFHLAAIHYIPLCEAEPGRAVSVNVAGTVNLLDAAPRGCTFIFASTAAVYAPEDEAHVEDSSAVGPMDIYGWTKIQGEEFVRYYHGRGRVSGVIVRLFNVVGSGETNPHLAPAIIEQLDEGTTSVQLGNLFPHRDYIDVTDAALGFRKLAAAAVPRADEPQLCNLGTGRSNEVGDVVRFIARAAGIDLAVEQDASRVRAIDRPMLKASTTKLESLTGWKPTTSLEESMRRAWSTRALDKLNA